MPRHGWLRWAPGIVLLMLAAPGFAYAQEPECPADSTSQSSGEINGIGSVEFPINLAPCQTLSITTTTWDNHPWWGAAFKLQLCNNPSGTCTQEAHTELDVDFWSHLNQPVTYQTPSGAPWVPPYRGTRGAEGLPVRAVFGTISNVAGKIFYQITISKVRRPEYNKGGSSTSNAPTVTMGTTYRGSLHPWEPGQYFKVHLEPNEGFAVAGTTLGHPLYGAFWEIDIVDGSNTVVQSVIFGTASGGPQPFSSNVYTNSTGMPQDLNVRFKCRYYPVHDFQIAFEAPKLTLYLDVDQNFDPDNPVDDSPQYLPCSNLDGTSRPLSECPQTVRVIAAYTVGSFIVKPPTVGDVTFALQDTSAFAGIAMNYPPTTNPNLPDYAFPSEATSVTVGFAPNARTVSTDLLVRDYGGLTTVKANNSAEMKLPRREELLPTAGWKVFPTPLGGPGEQVDASGREPDEDEDGPEAVGPPADNEGRALKGDGLSVYEEYRGFVIFGLHIRTHPDFKDLFIAGDDDSSGFGVGFAANLPLRLHHLCDPDVALGCGTREYTVDPQTPPTPQSQQNSHIVNANRANANGAAISGADQHGVKVLVMPATTEPLFAGCVFGFTYPIGLPRPVSLSATVTEGSPNQTDVVEIYLAPHNEMADPVDFNHCASALTSPLSATEVQNSVYKSIGHEVGHAVHVCHTDDTSSGGIAYDCPPPGVSIPSAVDSVMYNRTKRPIPQSTDLGAQYSSTDAGQIRLAVRP